jgi:hypothetical protein
MDAGNVVLQAIFVGQRCAPHFQIAKVPFDGGKFAIKNEAKKRTEIDDVPRLDRKQLDSTQSKQREK